jgi:hypothetical protein
VCKRRKKKKVPKEERGDIHTTKSGAHQNVKTFDGPLSKQHLGDL